MISASIQVERFDAALEEYRLIDVEVSGQSEYFGSYSPFERGEHIADWSVDSPKGFDLTPDEAVRAVEALEANI